MQTVLIITSQEKSVALFRELLAPRGYAVLDCAGDAGEAKRRMLQREYDLCLINAPLRDEFGSALAQELAQGSTQVALFAKSELCEQVAAQVGPHGVFVLQKPVNRQLLWGALQLMEASYSRLQNMQKQNRRLEQKLDDIRLINRAKCALVAYLKLSEEQAHKYIERQAMDMRLSRREVAESVLRTYEG